MLEESRFCHGRPLYAGAPTAAPTVWSPLAQGVLTGKYLPVQRPPEGSRLGDERVNGWMSRYSDEVLGRVQRLRGIADRLEITAAQLALAWVLRQRDVASAIIGASRPEQLRENIGASGLRLGTETLAEIDVVLEA
jgi:1-deoxyxylulose-5-phosphate synthase